MKDVPRLVVMSATIAMGLSGTACGNAPAGQNAVSTSRTDPVHETAVHVNRDGTRSIRFIDAPRERVMAMLAKRALHRAGSKANGADTPDTAASTSAPGTVATTSSAIMVEDCTDTNLFILDVPCGYDIVNMLCVSGAGDLDLSGIPNPRWREWDVSKAAYWPGFENGAFWESTILGLGAALVTNRFDTSEIGQCFDYPVGNWVTLFD
jgi:hypothetical protein